MSLAITTLDSPIGRLILAATPTALVSLHWPGAPAPAAVTEGPLPPVLKEATEQLHAYFTGVRVTFDLPLAPEGTVFQKAVWTALAKVPMGQTRTYQQLAQAIGRPRAMRAVGAALKANPLGLFLPCHRVVGHRGQLTGFAGGLTAKRWLLDHEQAGQGMPIA